MADGLTIEIDDARVLATFDGMPRAIRDALETKAGALALMLEAKIKGKLSGDVLNVRTGALRRSIFSDIIADEDGIHAYAASSADVPYAAIHEFGYVGIEHVRAHIRRITSAAGKEVTQNVKAFDREMNMPERSFLRTSLAEMEDIIVQGLQDAVRNAVGPR